MYGYFLGDEPQQQEQGSLFNGGFNGRNHDEMQAYLEAPLNYTPAQNPIPQQQPIGTNAEYQAKMAAPVANPLNQFIGDVGANAMPMGGGQYQGLGAGLESGQSRDIMNATGFGIARASQTAEAERGGAWGGIQNNGYVGDRPMPADILGYRGSFMGSSQGYQNDALGQQWDARQRNSLAQQEIQGRNQRARESSAMDMARLGIMSQDRQDAVSQRRQAKTWDIIGKLPEGKRLPFIMQGIHDGSLDKEVGSQMVIPEVIKGAAMNPGVMKEGKVSDLRAFLGGLQQRFDPKTMDGNGLIAALQGMGIDPNKVKEYKDDMQVGPFVKSILGPDVSVPNMSPWLRGLQNSIYGSTKPQSDIEQFKQGLPDWSQHIPQQQPQGGGAMQWLQSLLY